MSMFFFYFLSPKKNLKMGTKTTRKKTTKTTTKTTIKTTTNTTTGKKYYILIFFLKLKERKKNGNSSIISILERLSSLPYGPLCRQLLAPTGNFYCLVIKVHRFPTYFSCIERFSRLIQSDTDTEYLDVCRYNKKVICHQHIVFCRAQ